MAESSFFKSIRGVFLEDEKPSVAEQETPTPVVPVTPRKVLTVASPTALDPKVLSDLDESTKKTLLEAITLAGAAHVTELADLMETLRENIPDEVSLYKASLKFLKKKGVTVEDINKDYAKCLEALTQKQREFEDQLKAQFEKRIGSRTKAAEEARAQIQTKQQQLAQLQEEITNLENTAWSNEKGIAEEQAKKDLYSSRFNLNYTAIRSEVESQQQKLTQYGGTV